MLVNFAEKKSNYGFLFFRIKIFNRLRIKEDKLITDKITIVKDVKVRNKFYTVNNNSLIACWSYFVSKFKGKNYRRKTILIILEWMFKGEMEKNIYLQTLWKDENKIEKISSILVSAIKKSAEITGVKRKRTWNFFA